MDDMLLPFLKVRRVAALDRVEHRRAWRKIERDVVAQCAPGCKRYGARHTTLFDVRVADLLCLHVSVIAQPVAKKTPALENPRQIRDVRYVIDAGHLPQLFHG